MADETSRPKTKTGVMKVEQINEALDSAPVIHVDGGSGIAIIGENVRFNFTHDKLKTYKFSEDVETIDLIERAVCARLVMSPVAFVGLVDWLEKFVNETGLRSKTAQDEPN